MAQIDITRNQAIFLIEAISQKPLQTTLGAALAGVKLGNDLMELVDKLEVISKTIEGVTNENPQASPPPSGPVTEATEVEVVA